MRRHIQVGKANYMSKSTIEVVIYGTKAGPFGDDYNSCAPINCKDGFHALI
jgi:hypothetical protein